MKLNIHVVNISHADNFILPLKMAHAFGCDDSANTFSKGGGGSRKYWFFRKNDNSSNIL